MHQARTSRRLDRPVHEARDHILGPAGAEITLVEYGSYACPHCRIANERIADVRRRLGDRVRYVFRHRPVTGSDIARRAAELAEEAAELDRFWDAHTMLMTRSGTLTEDDLRSVTEELGLGSVNNDKKGEAARRAAARVDADIQSARASGVILTPTFYINGRRYDGPWDDSSFADAMLGRLGHRVRAAALDFASWGPSAGLLLLVATVLALALTNSPLGPGFTAFWQRTFSLAFDDSMLRLTILEWVNDGLLTIFFLVVGLEIKREFTVGHLAGWRSAALPVAAAIGGMTLPALLYILIIPSGPLAHGWGVPMATDTAFAIALIAVMGQRVPIELRVFLTAAAIVDDIGAILVVAVFYSEGLHLGFLSAAATIVIGLALFNQARIYRLAPYLLLGVALWICVHGSGLHATLAGVILALFIPTRPPANLRALTVQAGTIIATEARQKSGAVHYGPSAPALAALDAIHDRLESPASRMLRVAGSRSSYLVLPIFALANAGVVISTDAWTGHKLLMTAIIAGLVVGKPLGMILACLLAVQLRLAIKPAEYSWRQLAGAGALAGIGFTMSLFIADQAFPDPADFAAAKIAVFAASILAAVVGMALLWNAGDNTSDNEDS